MNVNNTNMKKGVDGCLWLGIRCRLSLDCYVSTRVIRSLDCVALDGGTIKDVQRI